MPELPEVEVTRRMIAPHFVGRTIREVLTTKPSYFFLTPPKRLQEQLPQKRVTALDRIGKYLVATLSDESRLVFHLGMTGQLFPAGARSVRLLSSKKRASLRGNEQIEFKGDKHTHLRLRFSKGEPEIFFRDTRKFGKVLWIPPHQTDARLDKLGPDALSVSAAHLWKEAQSRSIPVKTFLLDQSVLAGVGNIYADEALFATHIDPRTPTKKLTQKQITELTTQIQRVLKRAIRVGGSTIRDFMTPGGEDGGYQGKHMVYGRKGKPCLKCKTPVSRIVLAQRATHFCSVCQTKSRD